MLYKKVEDLRFDLNLLRVLSCVEKTKANVMPLTNEGAKFLAAFLVRKSCKKMQVGFFLDQTLFTAGVGRPLLFKC